jgi:hypothetical protein
MATTRKTATAKVTATSFNPSADAVKRTPAAKKPARQVDQKRVAATKAATAALDAGKLRQPKTRKSTVAALADETQANRVARKARKAVGSTQPLIDKKGKAVGSTQPLIDKKGKAVGSAKALDKIVSRGKVVKAAKKEDVLKFRGFIIPIKRKSTDSEESVPTIPVTGVGDTLKLFEKLPKGCTWMGDTADKTTMSVYNKSGALIADLRAVAK